MKRTTVAAAMAVSFALAGGKRGRAGARHDGATRDRGTGHEHGRQEGLDHLKTPEGTLILHFPPAALEGLKKGETISVDLAIQDNGPKPK